MHMRLKTLGAAVAASLVLTAGAVAPARPAQASIVNWFEVIITAVSTLAANSGGGGNDAQLEAAKQQIIHAVESSKQEILAHIDAIAAADVEACTQSAVTKFAQIDSMPGSLLGPFVNGAVDCAHLSSSYFNTVQSLPAADNIGKLMGVIYAIAMTGFAKYGLSTRSLLGNLITGYEAVAVKMKPTRCGMQDALQDNEVRPRPGDPMYWIVWCEAYNGDLANTTYNTIFPASPTEADFDAVRLQAGRNTSYATAVHALPALRAA
ncbi:hypothetical protein CLV70_102309 [Pseudosporangium ferrugineum]|uniref:Uncharacterized protein n=2 Tax=Pseudosporangium ferrugineum TaxID=439699 RepID=A0A2T0SFA6_9ACTN|nr:hypothetical protein CLV70_102309 [Pseudosporangium ferrugineum]